VINRCKFYREWAVVADVVERVQNFRDVEVADVRWEVMGDAGSVLIPNGVRRGYAVALSDLARTRMCL
jgi:hypothetical protein